MTLYGRHVAVFGGGVDPVGFSRYILDALLRTLLYTPRVWYLQSEIITHHNRVTQRLLIYQYYCVYIT